MKGYQPDRIVRVLTWVVSFGYYTTWVIIAFGVVAIVYTASVASDDAVANVSIPVNVASVEAHIVSKWTRPAADGRVTLSDVTAMLQFPAAAVPRWFRVVAVSSAVVGTALLMLFYYHLRRLFLRVRDGAPFDAQNATRLRWLGGLLLIYTLMRSAFVYSASRLATNTLSSSSTPIQSVLKIDWTDIFMALVLLALAEIFRRGTSLEDEQALVV